MRATLFEFHPPDSAERGADRDQMSIAEPEQVGESDLSFEVGVEVRVDGLR